MPVILPVSKIILNIRIIWEHHCNHGPWGVGSCIFRSNNEKIELKQPSKLVTLLGELTAIRMALDPIKDERNLIFSDSHNYFDILQLGWEDI